MCIYIYIYIYIRPRLPRPRLEAVKGGLAPDFPTKIIPTQIR